jgi:hypothetical protein
MSDQQTPLFKLTANYQLAGEPSVGDIAIDLQTCLQGALAVLTRLQDDGDLVSAEALGAHALLQIAEGLGSRLAERLNSPTPEG